MAVEREAEAIGAAIAAREQDEIARAVQLDLPEICGPVNPILCVQMDGTGVPVTNAEAAGRKGKRGCEPVPARSSLAACSRNRAATSEDAAALGRRLFHEAWRRGWSRARKRVVLGDGAAWIWNLAHEHCPGAIEIVDVYHAREHLWELAGKLFPNQETWRMQKKLDRGRVEPLVAELRGIETDSAGLARQLALEADYFERNAARMRYAEFRRQG
jgi:hypothetical protein